MSGRGRPGLCTYPRRTQLVAHCPKLVVRAATMSAFDNSKPQTDQEWHPMGDSFTTSAGQPSTPPAPRETWTQRMSRRVMQSRDPSDPRVSPATHPPSRSTSTARTVTTNARRRARRGRPAHRVPHGRVRRPRLAERLHALKQQAVDLQHNRHITCGTRSLS